MVNVGEELKCRSLSPKLKRDHELRVSCQQSDNEKPSAFVLSVNHTSGLSQVWRMGPEVCLPELLGGICSEWVKSVGSTFPVTAVTNYHKLGALKRCRCIILRFRTSEVLKSRCQQGHILSEALAEDPFLPFPLPPGLLPPWPVVAASQPSDVASVVTSLPLLTQHTTFSDSALCDGIGPTQTVQENLGNSRPLASSHPPNPFRHVR